MFDVLQNLRKMIVTAKGYARSNIVAILKEIVQTQVKFHHQFYFINTFTCFKRSSKFVLTFGVVRIRNYHF